MTQRHRSIYAAVLLTLLVFAASPFVTLVVLSSPGAAAAAPATPLLSDNFTQDTSLNANLWQTNGSVGTAFGSVDVGSSIVTLSPAFSSAGMEIAQINASYEAGTIQSLESFTPPFTATAVVEGTVSNGHTFGFALTTANASSGVLVYGNLNSTNCSHEGDCGDPTVCGTSANAGVPPNQCYYGIDAKAALGTGNWTSAPKLYLTPSVDVTYTLQISVDASGNAKYSVSQGGLVLGTSTTNVGTGPFYVILEQTEGAVVVSPGPNQAYWKSVALTAGAATISTTSTSVNTSPISTSSGISWFDWLIVAIVLILFLILLLLWYSNRRDLTITAEDSQTLSPIPEALVSTEGPEKLSGYTDTDGKINFRGVKKGDYTVQVVAKGYNPSLPVKITVKKKTKLTVKLDRTLPGAQVATGGVAPTSGPSPGTATVIPVAVPQPSPPTQPPAPLVEQPVQKAPSPTVARPAAPREQQEPEELEGFGGGRISEIIRTFQARGAISPETALTAQELGLSRLFVRIMKRRKGRTRIFVEINGRYYLDQKALQGM